MVRSCHIGAGNQIWCTESPSLELYLFILCISVLFVCMSMHHVDASCPWMPWDLGLQIVVSQLGALEEQTVLLNAEPLLLSLFCFCKTGSHLVA